MMVNGLFNDKGFKLLEKTLDFRSQRQEILSSNVANRDTPGYQAEDLVFEKALDQALHADQPGPMNTSHSRHFDGRNAEPLDSVQAQRITSGAPVVDFNGNTVDLDKEMAKMAENQLLYNTTTRLISHDFKLLNMSLDER